MTQFQIGNMHLSCSKDPYLDLAKKWQVIKYTKICHANDCVALKQAPSSQGDHQCVVLLMHMPRVTQVVIRYTLMCKHGQDRSISFAYVSLT
jgi:hypothetical protein